MRTNIATRKLTALCLSAVLVMSAGCGANVNYGESEESAELTESVLQIEAEIPSYDLETATVDPIPDQIYSGDPVEPSVSVTCDGKVLEEGEEYTLSYENNVNLGTATVTITGNGVSTVGSCSLTFNIITGDPVCDAEENQGIAAFVDRLYVYFLGRYPTLDEMTDNVRRLRSGSRSGMEAVNIIVQSDELEQRGIDEIAFVQAFYLAVLNRNADEDGLWYNVNLLWNGMSRVDLVNGIMDVPGGEFDIFCSSIGINLGSGHEAGRAPDMNDGIPTSSFNYTVGDRTVTIHRRAYQFITVADEGDSIFDLDSMCALAGLELISDDDGSFVYGTGVYQLTLSGGSMSLMIGADEVSHYDDVVEDGTEVFRVNDTDTTVSLGMIVMIEYSLENLAVE